MELEILLGGLALFGAGFGAGFFVNKVLHYHGKKQQDSDSTEIFCSRYCLQTEYEKLYESIKNTRELIVGDLDSLEMEENMLVNVGISLGYEDIDKTRE